MHIHWRWCRQEIWLLWYACTLMMGPNSDESRELFCKNIVNCKIKNDACAPCGKRLIVLATMIQLRYCDSVNCVRVFFSPLFFCLFAMYSNQGGNVLQSNNNSNPLDSIILTETRLQVLLLAGALWLMVTSFEIFWITLMHMVLPKRQLRLSRLKSPFLPPKKKNFKEIVCCVTSRTYDEHH